MSRTNKVNREVLIAKAGKLFRIKGYYNTSMSDIAQHCHISKAHLYYYIKDKKTLAFSAIALVHEHFTAEIASIAYNEAYSKQERLVQFMTAIEAFFIDREGGCLIGNLALETSESEIEFNHLFKAYFTEWMNVLTHLLSDVFELSQAKQLSEDAVLATQGSLMLKRIYQNPEPLLRIKRDLLAKFEAQSVAINKSRKLNELPV